jgi:hypothetical protein
MTERCLANWGRFTCAYSVSFKRIVLLDCLVLAGLYTLRVILILELNEEKFSRLEKLEVGKYNQLQIRLIDEGKGWGEWSAIFLGK